MRQRFCLLALAGSILLLVFGILEYQKSSEQSGKIEAFNQRLIELQPKLLAGKSVEAEQFIAEASKQGYAPTHYIRALQLGLPPEANQDFTDITFALQNGVLNAALLLIGDHRGLAPNELRSLALEALNKLSEKSNFFTLVARIQLIGEGKDAAKNKWDSKTFKTQTASQFTSLYEKGSPLTMLLALEVVSDDQLRGPLCQVLGISMQSQYAKSCKALQGPAKYKIDVELISAGIKSYRQATEDRYGNKIEYYKRAVCGKLASDFADGPFCTDILDFIFSLCSMKVDDPDLAPVDGLMVCSQAEIDREIKSIADVFHPMTERIIFEN